MEEQSKLEEFEIQQKEKNNIFQFTILEALLAALIVFFGGQVLSIPLGLLQTFVPETSHFTIPLSYGISFVGAIFLLNLWKNFGWDFIKNQLKKVPNFLFLIISTVMFFSAMPFVELTTSLFPTSGFYGIIDFIYKVFIEIFEEVFKYKVAAVITVAILAPILEEIILRGIILKGMLNKNVTPWIAICFSAFLFGLIHANPWQFIAATIMGIILGFVYYKTNNLWICIILHALNNSISSYFALKYGMEDNLEMFSSSSNYYPFLVVGGIALSVLFGFLLHFVAKNKAEKNSLQHI